MKSGFVDIRDSGHMTDAKTVLINSVRVRLPDIRRPTPASSSSHASHKCHAPSRQ